MKLTAIIFSLNSESVSVKFKKVLCKIVFLRLYDKTIQNKIRTNSYKRQFY